MTTSAYFFWVLRGPGGPVVIDTGFTHRLGRVKSIPVEQMRTRDDLCAAVKLDPNSVETVILTHMHWDHFDLEGAFPKAMFWVQKRELEFWTGYGGQETWHQRFISDCLLEDVQSLRASGRLNAVDGVHEPARGIRVEWVGGHSPGMQIVVVESARGPFVLANDALTAYRNLRDWMPPAIHLRSVQECLEGMKRIQTLCGGDESRLCPGHDSEVWQRFPEIAPGVFRLV
jgi:glyoxylase-like metal-dependent hydrolase (beta-lactamase superfamily II)